MAVIKLQLRTNGGWGWGWGGVGCAGAPKSGPHPGHPSQKSWDTPLQQSFSISPCTVIALFFDWLLTSLEFWTIEIIKTSKWYKAYLYCHPVTMTWRPMITGITRISGGSCVNKDKGVQEKEIQVFSVTHLYKEEVPVPSSKQIYETQAMEEKVLSFMCSILELSPKQHRKLSTTIWTFGQ